MSAPNARYSRPRRLSPFLLVATLGGCDAPDDPDPDARVAPAALLLEDAPVDPRHCDEIVAEAGDLLAEEMTCGDDLDCEAEPGTVVSEDPCLPQLACWLAVSTDERVELDAVLDRLQALDAEYRESCGTCPVPMCVDPDLVFASCERDACALRVAPPIEEIASLASPAAH